MTQEEKRIKLAESAGWTIINDFIAPDLNGIGKTIGNAKIPPGQLLSEMDWFEQADLFNNELPDYFNDLNAVHELEEELDDSQKMLYVAKLSQILSPSKFPQSFRILHATAEQRCEALGLTLNLW